MAEKIKENQFDEQGVNPFNAPIPGESLTTAPDMPKAWEQPAQYVDQNKAMEAVYMELTEEDTLRKLINMINDGTPLDQIAQVTLYKGYTEGKFSPDLMLMLIEPTLYLLIAIADYAEIKDYILYNEEVDDEEDTDLPPDNITPVDMDGDGIPDEESAVSKGEEPKKESLGESLLARVEGELPAKVKEIKEEE
jgi:hypothetical protein|tara:strand:+ start:365 stop:943 length:579 start_codon:yes stop_codon:yes gene_type:complete